MSDVNAVQQMSIGLGSYFGYFVSAQWPPAGAP
jgi:hypothetical protein